MTVVFTLFLSVCVGGGIRISVCVLGLCNGDSSETLCGPHKKQPESSCNENTLKISSKNGLIAAECEDFRFVCPLGAALFTQL